jgi:hypothetical protein
MQTEHEMSVDVVKDIAACIAGLAMLIGLCLIVGSWIGVV